MKLHYALALLVASSLYVTSDAHSQLRGLLRSTSLIGSKTAKSPKTVSTTSETTEDECPTMPPGSICTLEFDPYQCGPNDCNYSNSCMASSAGFDIEADCEPANQESASPLPSCPESELTACPKIFQPVLCGECRYNNPCLADAAGYSVETDCTDDALPMQQEETTTCPETPDGIACTFEFNPQVCGDDECEYSNPCLAGAAGFDVESDCTSANDDSDSSNCPTGSSDVPCTLENEPYLCGGSDSCEYGNACLAEAAGFNAREDCIPLFIIEPPPTDNGSVGGQDDSCPTGSSDVPCTLEFMPYSCGPNDCSYDNSCLAEAAGFNVDNDCVTQDLDTPDFINECAESDPTAACTKIMDPVLCGIVRCEYNNLCLAEAAGYPAESCSSAIPSANCPTSPPGTACTFEYMPYLCGPQDCEYSNSCLAETAGYDLEADCVSLFDMPIVEPEEVSSCPMPGGARPCPAIFAPVVCGDCNYDNECIAESAGFSADECEPDEESGFAVCPLPAPDTACIEIYAPVTCGDDECFYSNSCNAEAAGFTEADCTAEPLEEPTVGGGTPFPPGAGEPNYTIDENNCPVTGPAVSCLAIFQPVVCSRGPYTDCEYSSFCLAAGAGYEADMCECACGEDDGEGCTCPPELSESGSGSSNECPVGPPNVPCTLEYMPYTCGPDACEYGNACSAEAAGYDIEGDCMPMDLPAVEPIPESDRYVIDFTIDDNNCPVTGPAWSCLRLDEPVLCSRDDYTGCEYGSLCLALGAGYISSECECTCDETAADATCTCPPDLEVEVSGSMVEGEVDDTDPEDCPQPRPVACITLFAPVTCSRGTRIVNCQYSNSCVAEAAGFTVDEECMDGPM